MNIREIIQQIVGDMRVFGTPAIVTAVDAVASTCTVEPVDGAAPIEDVRLQASPDSGILCIPAVNSAVMVQLFSESEAYVTMFSKLESVQFLDGSFGGVTKTQELKTQLDKSNDVLQTIQTVITTWSPVPNDGGAALKAAMISALTGKTVGNFSQIENEKITHGTV